MASLTDVRKRIAITFGMLILYRLMTFIPIPFIDFEKLAVFAEGARKGIFGMFNSFSGGSISRASIFSLGIMPYITASIVVQLLMSGSDEYKKMKKESPDIWQKKMNQFTKYLTVLVGLGQGLAFANSLILTGLNSNINPTTFKLATSIIMLSGTFSTLWFAEKLGAVGIGNGTSLIICLGIVAEGPKDLANVFYMSKIGATSNLAALGLIGLFVANVALVVFVERSQRLIHIQYPRQAMMQMQQKTPFLPLKVNLAGVIPTIFASALLLLPLTVIGFFKDKTHPVIYFISSNLIHGKPLFIILYGILIMTFSLVYNNVVFDPNDMAEQLKRSNVFIPGSRPGKSTADLLKNIMKRLSVIGGMYLCVIALVPEFFIDLYGSSFLIGGTGILIVVNVIIETMTSLQATMLSSKYNKVMKKYKNR